MADLAITAANVKPGANAVIDRSGLFGAAVNAGQAVYREAATGLFKLADANSATAEAKVPYGIAVDSGVANQPAAIQKSGDVTVDAVLTAGLAYYLSATPGGICPVADVGAGMNPSVLGMAKSATVFAINIQSPGVTL